jgi:hypothetical protein
VLRDPCWMLGFCEVRNERHEIACRRLVFRHALGPGDPGGSVPRIKIRRRVWWGALTRRDGNTGSEVI